MKRALWIGAGGALGIVSLYGTAKYAALATGNPMLDRFAIRGSALLYATLQGLRADVVMAIIHQESGGNPAHYIGDTTSSHGPSIGPMQVSRDTAKELGLWVWNPDGIHSEREAYAALSDHEEEGIRWGCAVLKEKLRQAGGDYSDAIRRYNGSGPAAESYRDTVLAFLGDTFPGSTDGPEFSIA